MIETELKILLDAAGMARLRRHPALAGLRLAPRRNERLVSIYYDTAGYALAAGGIALRLRRVGKTWVQTVKRRTGGEAAGGLFANRESECPAPGGRLSLAGADPDGALAAVREATAGAPLSPMFETRVQRMSELLAAPGGGQVELALDTGEIRTGEASVAISEAELELKAGGVDALYDLARTLFPTGPVRFATENKSARGYALARSGTPVTAAAPRVASVVALAEDATVETVARDFFRDCLAQIAGNVVVVAESDAPEGPHQLRVGLRRLRTGFLVFAAGLGEAAMAPLAAEAKRLGQDVGVLRDLDVLIADVAAVAGTGLDAAAMAALGGALELRRQATRREVRRTLVSAEATGFVFDLASFIEGRGWLLPSDYSQTDRLAAPIQSLSPTILDRRHRRVMKRGRGIRDLNAEALHALRKELKKLRYTVDMLGPLYRDGRVEPYLKALKALQDGFGSLNDAAMARAILAAADGPGAADPAAQRGVGWVLGVLQARVAEDRPRLFDRWDRLRDAAPFWR